MTILAATLLLLVPYPQSNATSAGSAAAASEARDDTRPGLWSQWRGPARDGIDSGREWPERLTDENFVQQWRVELGPSYSGPVVDAKRVYTTATVDEKDEIVRALDRETGETVWEKSWRGSMKVPFFAARNGSWIRATPTLAEGRLFVSGILDVLVCFGAETGEEIWRVDFKERYEQKKPDFGAVTSPLVVGDHVYTQAANSVVKLVAATGESVWRTPNGEDSSMMSSGSFSSPILVTLGGKEQLVVQTREELRGLDPSDGKVLWSQPVKHFRGMNILTPQPVGDESLFTSTYQGRAHLYKISEGEDGWSSTEEWTARAAGYMSSPVVVGQHLYLYLQSKRFACVDLEAGETNWISDPIGDEYWSLIAQGERMLALTEAGELLLIQHNPKELQVIDRRDVAKSETWGHLAVDGDQIFVREQDGLTAFRWAADK